VRRLGSGRPLRDDTGHRLLGRPWIAPGRGWARRSGERLFPPRRGLEAPAGLPAAIGGPGRSGHTRRSRARTGRASLAHAVFRGGGLRIRPAGGPCQGNRHGGAAVSVLAFAGGHISQGKLGLGPQANDISFSLLLFALGVLAGALGIGFAYFTNYCVTGHYQSRIKQWEQPYLVETPGSRRWAYGATFFRTLAIACGFGSAILFVSGVLQVRNAIIQTGGHVIRDGS
jgi:hypothetical protein